jgi:hypothetical protein
MPMHKVSSNDQPNCDLQIPTIFKDTQDPNSKPISSLKAFPTYKGTSNRGKVRRIFLRTPPHSHY